MLGNCGQVTDWNRPSLYTNDLYYFSVGGWFGVNSVRISSRKIYASGKCKKNNNDKSETTYYNDTQYIHCSHCVVDTKRTKKRDPKTVKPMDATPSPNIVSDTYFSILICYNSVYDIYLLISYYPIILLSSYFFRIFNNNCLNSKW